MQTQCRCTSRKLKKKSRKISISNFLFWVKISTSISKFFIQPSPTEWVGLHCTRSPWIQFRFRLIIHFLQRPVPSFLDFRQKFRFATTLVVTMIYNKSWKKCRWSVITLPVLITHHRNRVENNYPAVLLYSQPYRTQYPKPSFFYLNFLYFFRTWAMQKLYHRMMAPFSGLWWIFLIENNARIRRLKFK